MKNKMEVRGDEVQRKVRHAISRIRTDFNPLSRSFLTSFVVVPPPPRTAVDDIGVACGDESKTRATTALLDKVIRAPSSEITFVELLSASAPSTDAMVVATGTREEGDLD